MFEALERARMGFPVTDPINETGLMANYMQTLYVTGHGLGAAMAAIMGVTIHTEPLHREYFEKTLQAVYTFGQPMIGSVKLADMCAANEFVNDKLIRYIYKKDPAPHLPQTGSVIWKNFGLKYQFRGGAWRKNKNAKSMPLIPLISRLLSAAAAFFARLIPVWGATVAAVERLFPRGLPSAHKIEDHGPQHYIAALTPRGTRTEFGSYNQL